MNGNEKMDVAKPGCSSGMLAKRKALSEEIRTKNCKQCGKPFDAKYKHERYCKECPPGTRPKHGDKPLVERSCASCGKPYLNRNERIRVCSMACSNEYKRMMKNKPLLPRACSQCGTIFTPKNHRAIYCSQKCLSRSGYLRQASGTTGRKQASCETCGREFLQYNSMHVMCDGCSPSKKIRNQEIERVCTFCGGKFSKAGKGFHLICPPCREKFPKQVPYRSKEPCENCGKYFTHVNKRARFCSLSCSSTWLNAAGHGPRHDDEKLHSHLVGVIQAHETSLSMEELVYESGVAEKVLTLRGWTIQSLYEDAGRAYGPPRLCSHFEDRVYEVLCALVPPAEIETQKDLPGMVGIKGGRQLTDFYIESMRLIIEADGNIHRDPVYGLENLEYAKANDQAKNEYAAANGLTILRIEQTLNRRAIKARLLRGIRRAHPAFAALNPSNALNTSGPARRGIVRTANRERPDSK